MSFRVVHIFLMLSLFSILYESKAQTTIQPAFDFDQRFYFTKDWRQNIWGYRGGIIVNKKYKLGIGAYYENDKQFFATTSSLAKSFNCISPFNLQQKLVMGCIYYEPFLYRAELWETSIVSELGFGHVKQEYIFDNYHKLSFANKGSIIPLGIGWSLNLKGPILPKFKPISWIGLNLMAGYRTDILYNSVANTDFNGWYWSLSGAFFLDRISSDVKEYRKNKLKL